MPAKLLCGREAAVSGVGEGIPDVFVNRKFQERIWGFGFRTWVWPVYVIPQVKPRIGNGLLVRARGAYISALSMSTRSRLAYYVVQAIFPSGLLEHTVRW